MKPTELCKIAGRLMRHPVAAFHEHAVRDEVERICAERGLKFQRDRFGNVLVRLHTSRNARAIVYAAHMDHPGFEIIRPLAKTRWLARFLGGVPDSYFRRGVPLRLMPESAPARLGPRRGKDKEYEIHSKHPPAAPPRFAVWELEDFRARNGRIHGRACDDLIGVASVLATLIDLKRRRVRVNAIGVISRAEEIGFLGALAVAGAKELPANALVISLETSRELPGVKMGGGVILRVGDRTSIFNSAATRFLSESANALKSRNPAFEFQRALMSGGTCEATAYQEFGFETTAVCVALGNYHNCAAGNRIRAEFVSVADACGMVELLGEAAKQLPNYSRLIGKLPARLKQLRREGTKRLLASK